jgi:cytochrome c-type biogenesis protein CcmH
MMLFFLASVLIIVVLGILLLPLFRSNPVGDDALQHNLTVFRDQLLELDRDSEAGLITGEEKDAARLEIERRLIAAQKQLSEQKRLEMPGRTEILIAALIGLVPLLAAGFYMQIGRPDLPASPYAQRTDLARANAMDAGSHPEMNALIEELKQRLEEDPESLEGWSLLARSQANIGDYESALAAYGKAIEMTGGRNAQIAAEYAETLVLASEGMVIPEAENIFQNLLLEDENDPQALFYIGLAEAQRGDDENALIRWRKIIEVSPADAPWLSAVQAQIAELSGEEAPPPPLPVRSGPSQDQMDAVQSMSAEEQTAMINTMVEGLADRLKENPDDLEGWQRLARAYQVLGRTSEEQSALAQIIRLAPDDQAAKARIEELAR